MVYGIVLGVLLAVIGIVLLRTFNFKSKKHPIEGLKNTLVDVEKAAKNLSGSIKVKTISSPDFSEVEWEEFEKLHKYLDKTYPLIHARLEKEIVNDYGLVYRWQGKQKDKNPILLIAHMDVVPVEKGTEADWSHEPFSGTIADGYVWGRGSLDIKVQMIAIMEAVENLLNEEYIPDRDVYMAFGFDEEVGGYKGAKEIAKTFKDKGITFDCVLDEGGAVTEGALKEIESPLAFIGTCEKGQANIRLTAFSKGGHSSTPPRSTTIGKIGKSIQSLEKNQLKLKMSQPVQDMFSYIGPEMNFVNKMILSNLWLFKPIFLRFFSKNNQGNALLRTTTAATMLKGSDAANVLPQKASGVVNFRISPGDSINDLLTHVKRNVDEDIEVEVLRGDEPSKVSSTDTEAFKVLEKTVYQIYPEAIVSPYLVLGGTDARKYEIVSDNIYRFSPYKITADELSKIHSTNERISLKNIEMCVRFFRQFIKNANEI